MSVQAALMTDDQKGKTMALEAILKVAVAEAISETIAAKARDIATRETLRALREHEDQLTHIIRAAVDAAIAEMLA
jgi:hypothetical protein